MTTRREYEQLPTFTTVELVPISSDPDEDFLHPVLEIFKPAPKIREVKKPRLYLVPSTFGEEFDSEFAPQPTSASELPDIQPLLLQFIYNVVEIWAGRRVAQQLQSMCHYKVYSELQKDAGSLKEVGRVRKSRVTQPLDGVCEATVTIRFGDRLRVVAIRFEGLDGRWLCTCLTLI
ncbi:MAG: hypothetical protein RJA96_216 [Actinomycetota bacterium]|jgi:hypothetical protein